MPGDGAAKETFAVLFPWRVDAGDQGGHHECRSDPALFFLMGRGIRWIKYRPLISIPSSRLPSCTADAAMWAAHSMVHPGSMACAGCGRGPQRDGDYGSHVLRRAMQSGERRFQT